MGFQWLSRFRRAGISDLPERQDGFILEKVLADLSSGKRSRQNSARVCLMEMAEPDSVWHGDLDARLEQIAASADAFSRGAAYLALAISRGEKAVEILMSRIEEPEADARIDLTMALARIGAPAREGLLKLLRDRFLEIRFSAARGLLDIGGLSDEERENCLSIFLEALGFDDMRYMALGGLYELNDGRALEPARGILGKFFISGFDRVAAAGILARQGERSGVEFLIEKAGGRKGLERGLALELLGELKLPEAESALLAAANDRKNDFRGAALKAAGRAGCGGAETLLTEVLLSEFEPDGIRADAAEGLASLGTQTAGKTLEKLSSKISSGGESASWPELAGTLRAVLEEIRKQEQRG